MSLYEKAKSRVMDVGMTLVRKEGEFRVNYRGGKEATAYYTNNLEDAVTTAELMSKNLMKTPKVVITIDTTSDAFAGDDFELAVAGVLDRVSKKIAGLPSARVYEFTIPDINGNTVAHVRVIR